MSEMKRCDRCVYWSAKISTSSPFRIGDGFGECRRHAPRGLLTFTEEDDKINYAPMRSFLWRRTIGAENFLHPKPNP